MPLLAFGCALAWPCACVGHSCEQMGPCVAGWGRLGVQRGLQSVWPLSREAASEAVKGVVQDAGALDKTVWLGATSV